MFFFFISLDSGSRYSLQPGEEILFFLCCFPFSSFLISFHRSHLIFFTTSWRDIFFFAFVVVFLSLIFSFYSIDGTRYSLQPGEEMIFYNHPTFCLRLTNSFFLWMMSFQIQHLIFLKCSLSIWSFSDQQRHNLYGGSKRGVEMWSQVLIYFLLWWSLTSRDKYTRVYVLHRGYPDQSDDVYESYWPDLTILTSTKIFTHAYMWLRRGYPEPVLTWRREDNQPIMLRDSNGGQTQGNVTIYDFISWFCILNNNNKKSRSCLGTVCSVQWPCGILAIAVKTLSQGKLYFWGYFSYVLLRRKHEKLFCFSFSGTRNIIFGTLKIGQNDPEIPNLEFENHGFLENQVFLPTEQAGTNICWMIYQDTNFKICLSLFGWKEKILPNLHIVQCAKWTDVRMSMNLVNPALLQYSFPEVQIREETEIGVNELKPPRLGWNHNMAWHFQYWRTKAISRFTL